MVFFIKNLGKKINIDMAMRFQKPTFIGIIGDVDHGKSTLIGRVMHATGQLYTGQYGSIVDSSMRRGTKDIQWSFLTDTLQKEREEKITIDVSYIPFVSKNTSYVIVDCPGHKKFIRNILSGMSNVDFSVVLIDPVLGVTTNTRRHLLLLSLINVRTCIVAVNKMDLVAYDEKRFLQIVCECTRLAPDGMRLRFIPISALCGENITQRSQLMSWFEGETLIELFDKVSNEREKRKDEASIFFVQNTIVKNGKNFYLGRVVEGCFHANQTVGLYPYGVIAHVRSIVRWDEGSHELLLCDTASSGDSVAICFEEGDENLPKLSHGDVVGVQERPPLICLDTTATVFWLSDTVSFQLGNAYEIQIGPQRRKIVPMAIEDVLNTNTFKREGLSPFLKSMCFGCVRCHATLPIVTSPSSESFMRRFVIYREEVACGVGVLSEQTSY